MCCPVDRIRTDTGWRLGPLPLPKLGYDGDDGTHGPIRTDTLRGLNALPRPSWATWALFGATESDRRNGVQSAGASHWNPECARVESNHQAAAFEAARYAKVPVTRAVAEAGLLERHALIAREPLSRRSWHLASSASVEEGGRVERLTLSGPPGFEAGVAPLPLHLP